MFLWQIRCLSAFDGLEWKEECDFQHKRILSSYTSVLGKPLLILMLNTCHWSNCHICNIWQTTASCISGERIIFTVVAFLPQNGSRLFNVLPFLPPSWNQVFQLHFIIHGFSCHAISIPLGWDQLMILNLAHLNIKARLAFLKGGPSMHGGDK